MTRFLGIAAIGCMITLGFLPFVDEDLSKELPRIKAIPASEAIASFQIHPGFRLHPAAVEPLVTDPVSACYDADGRLYVVEMRGYPYPENTPTGNVRLLEDTDGDGTFDKSTIFLDGLSWPTGVVPFDGGAFIAVAPDILYAKDTNGDGVADVKKVMFRGFGTQNVQGLVNGLLWGPDGWIYGVSGGNGGDILNATRPGSKPVSVRGRDFRFRPDGSAFEAISGGGQFGHAFDDWGNRFTCNNSNHIRQIVLPSKAVEANPALVVPAVLTDIAVEGPAAKVFRISQPEPWRVVRTRQRAADPEMRKRLPPTELFAFGFFTSATGVTIYRGTAFPSEYQGNAFIGDVGGNLVHRKILRPKGSIFEAIRADENLEFLASKDNWFRPVNFANTPSGTLLVLDMYRETIEHPLSIPEPIKKHLDLTSGKDRGRIYELLPLTFKRRAKPALSQASTEQLVTHLADRDAWWRETAQRLLIERRDPLAVPLMKKMADVRPSALGRVHAIWTLSALGHLTEADVLLALRDPEARVRAQSAALSNTLRPGSRDLEFAVARLADDPDAAVRFQVALAPKSEEHGGPLTEQAKILRRDAADPWTRFAVYSSATGARSSQLLVQSCLRDPFGRTPGGRIVAEELGEIVGAGNDSSSIERSLSIVADASVGPHVPRAMVIGLGRGLQRVGRSLRTIVEKSGNREAIGKIFDQAARDAASDQDAPARVDAIRILGVGAPTEACLRVLPPLLDARQPVEVQLAALQAMASLSDPAVGRLVAEHWKGLSPSARREAAEVLFARPERLSAMMDAIEAKSFPANEVEPARRKQILAHPVAKLRERARRVLGTDPKADRSRVIGAFQPALTLGGNRQKGRSVFEKTCATCHKADGLGESVGPDLATVTGRTPEDLLIHILDPNREVNPQYLDYSVATSDGRIVTGLIASETANSVTLRRAAGATDVIPRTQIEAIASTGVSLMPDGLETGLTHQDFADLVAFLRDLQASPPEKSGR
ncbi:MAG: putative rane-bound dehydrogenase [Planctomycetota bacterium]|nr:putative rane-bound dehydrogenase [Planctomycetota bacterium]